MKQAPLIFVLLLLAFSLTLSGCTHPSPEPAPIPSSNPSVQSNPSPPSNDIQYSNNTQQPAIITPTALGASENTSGHNTSNTQNGSAPHDATYWQQVVGFGMTRAQWTQANAELDFSNAVCNMLPDHATRIVNFPAPAIFIPANMSADLANFDNDSFDFVSPQAFVGSPQDPSMDVFIPPNPSSLDPASDRYYWNCWVNGDGDTRICLIPITATINAANGVETKTGVIKLTFNGPLMPLTSACNWTPPNTTNDSGYSCPTTGGAPCWSPPPSPGSTPPDTPECTNPPANTNPGGESGPHDVIYLPHPKVDTPAPVDTKPGPRINTSTFNRTGCEVDFDPECPPPDAGQQLCGQCSYGSALSVITYDQWHTDPAGHVKNLGACHYCPSADKCSGSDAYGICGNEVCIAPPSPNPNPTYTVTCGQCQNGPPQSYSGPSWDECNYYYQICAQQACGVEKDNCR